MNSANNILNVLSSTCHVTLTGIALLLLSHCDNDGREKSKLTTDQLPVSITEQSDFSTLKQEATYPAGQLYYVSPAGDDNNEGRSPDKPLKTIRTAVEKMNEGDVCFLRKGIYRETVVIRKNALTFRNYENEVAVISGLDPVTHWSHHTGSIFKAPFIPAEADQDPSKASHLNEKGNYFIQVFTNGREMPQAQYPDRSGELLDWEKHGGDVRIMLNGKFQFTSDSKKEWPENYWKGAVFHAIVERKFNAVQGVVGRHNGTLIQCAEYTAGWKSSTATKFTKNLFTEENGVPTGIGKGFLTNHLHALTTAEEWYWDKPSGTLYFQPPANTPVEQLNVEAKSRKFAFVMSGTHQVRVEGIHIFAAGIDMRNAHNTTIERCRIQYPMSFYLHQDEYNGKAMIIIDGNGNHIKDCYIGHAWGSGVMVLDGVRNTIENTLIEDVDWMGTYNACIRAGGEQTQLVHNTLRKSGRFLIEGVGLRNSKITHNDLYNGLLIGQDGGGFYTYVTDGKQTEIAFNWVHDIVGIPWERSTATNDHNLTVGIYLDGGCKQYNVHHNVIWNTKYGVVLNANPGKVSEGNKVDYNTIIAADVAVLSKNMPAVYINNSARHNLVNKKVAALVEKEDNIIDPTGDLEKKFPKRSEKISRTNPGKSLSPDSFEYDRNAGAYEKQVPRWKAGADTTSHLRPEKYQ